ncbi:MAG: sugar ABC transporter permease [Deinococcota bacterium]
MALNSNQSLRKTRSVPQRHFNQRQLAGLWFILPAALSLLVIVAYPLLYGFYISLFRTNLLTRWDFRWFQNYIRIFTSADFLQTVFTTLKFTVGAVAGQFVVGLSLALLLNTKVPGRALFRTILIVPWLFPEVVVALLWKWMYNPLYGLFNDILLILNVISEPTSWLGSTATALPSVILTVIWKGYPLVMLLMLAGLQAISQEQYESAEIDGASWWQSFLYITLPNLRNVIMITLILNTVWWFKHFGIVWVLTQGGPINATSVISIDIYKTAFEAFRFGRAAALAVIVFFIVFLISFLYQRFLGGDE